MATITIKNVGPIEEILNLELNKVNVFMGPQSSGKSTIAKIISYCTWVEKKASLTQSFTEIDFINELVVFHKLKGYFRNDSSLEYESDIIKFKYDHGKGQPHFEWKNRYDFKRSKISYIPAERNLVSAIENWFDVRFKENNFLNFMKEWEDARKIYTKTSPLTILELGVQYYYDEKSGQDFVIVDNKGTTLELANTSSGLQSAIPFIVITEYITVRIYEKVNIKRSVRDEQIEHFIKEKIYNDLFRENNQTRDIPADGEKQPIGIESNVPWRAEINPSKPIQHTVNQQEIQENNWLHIFTSEEKQKKYNEKTDCFLNTQYTQFIIEEPEQNLFPETQRDLVYYLLEKLQSEKEHRLTITTHSPYILYALNNCMMGGLVKEQIKDKKLKEEFLNNEFLSKNSWINPQLVSIWEIEEGKIKRIQDKDNIISENYFDQKMTEITDEYYQILNYYNDEE